MKQFLLLLLCALSLRATTTTVAQTITNPDGTLASGTAIIKITAPCTSGANRVGDATKTVKFINGAFSVSLVPNDTCTPAGTSYTVGWLLANGRQWSETWIVPTSGTPVSVDSVIVASPVPVPVRFSLAGITPGVADGYYCVRVLGGIPILTTTGCPGTATTGGLTTGLAALTDSDLLTLTNVLLLALGN